MALFGPQRFVIVKLNDLSSRRNERPKQFGINFIPVLNYNISIFYKSLISNSITRSMYISKLSCTKSDNLRNMGIVMPDQKGDHDDNDNDDGNGNVLPPGNGNSGGGGGGGDEDDHQENEFGPLMKFDEVMELAESHGVNLPKDMSQAAKATGLRKLILTRYLDLQRSGWILGFLTRNVVMFRNRMLADPSFLFKVGTENFRQLKRKASTQQQPKTGRLSHICSVDNAGRRKQNSIGFTQVLLQESITEEKNDLEKLILEEKDYDETARFIETSLRMHATKQDTDVLCTAYENFIIRVYMKQHNLIRSIEQDETKGKDLINVSHMINNHRSIIVKELSDVYDKGSGWILGFLTRHFVAFRNRMLADPSFLFKVGTEMVIDSCSATVAEVQKRGEDFWDEFELYAADFLVGIVVDIALVGLLAPYARFGKQSVASGGLFSGLRNSVAALPSSVFEFERPGSKFSAQQRVATYFYKGLLYGSVGFGCGLVCQGFANMIMNAKRRMRASERDVPVPPLMQSALLWGVFLGVSANTRYQIINGLESVVEASSLAKQVPLVARTFTVGVRFSNNIYGWMQFVDWAKWTGVQ